MGRTLLPIKMTFATFVLQAFNGLSLFTVLLLMALGLAIVFEIGRAHV